MVSTHVTCDIAGAVINLRPGALLRMRANPPAAVWWTNPAMPAT
jgi:hypothetical protein